MPEEYEYLEGQEQNPEEQRLSQAQTKKQRNVANNANLVRNAADIASKTNHPYAKAIGGAVKAADKISGGKASEKLGKVLNHANKTNPYGRITQAAFNKLSESGTADRIGKAVNKKNTQTRSALANVSTNAQAEGKSPESAMQRREVEDETSDGGEATLKATAKFLKVAMIAMIPVMVVVIFIGVLTTTSLAVESLIGVGNADETKDSEMTTKMENADEDLKDKDKSTNSQTFNQDLFIDEQGSNFRNSKLKKISKVREYNEADISKLEDYYPNMSSYIDEDGNNINLVHTFFFKMHYLYFYYYNNYHVDLDMPLLMATLTVRESDMSEVFESNIIGYGKSEVEKQTNNDRFSYDAVHNYVSTEDKAQYDMEVLAQNMVSKVEYVAEEKNCENPVGGYCYLLDEDKYDSFLKTFLADKYSLENENSVYGLIVQIHDVRDQYEDLVGDYEETVTLNEATFTSYWWPIGSSETTVANGVTYAKGDPETTLITSPFGYRIDPLGRGTRFHSGLDIAGGSGLGNVNIIASRDGIVVETNDGCPSSSSLSSCGGGYGNYVIIQHSDGNYTLYAHLHSNTITVKQGVSVSQGQVIAKMGSSGNSTGAHLHFEVREGANAYNATVDPLNYISADNPRIVSAGGDFLSWLNSWEGSSPISGDYYIVENIGDGVRTVGGGVTLEHNADRFAEYGIDINDYPVGSKIPISIVDSIQLEEIASKRSYIENVLSNNSITLQEKQIQALVSQMYNCGNINGFVAAYKEYGNTDTFYDTWFFRNIMKGSIFEQGLRRRRNAEWSLFHSGEYVYNG